MPTFKLSFKTTFLLWVKGERTVFIFSFVFFFVFIASLLPDLYQNRAYVFWCLASGLLMRPAWSCWCKQACRHINWSHRQHNKFYWQLHWQKFLFFWRLKRDLSLNFCVCHKKSKIMNWTKAFCYYYLYVRCM